MNHIPFVFSLALVGATPFSIVACSADEPGAVPQGGSRVGGEGVDGAAGGGGAGVGVGVEPGATAPGDPLAGMGLSSPGEELPVSHTIFWLLQNAVGAEVARSGPNVPLVPDHPEPAWYVAAVGDFEGDGRNDDLVWRNLQTGDNEVWRMNGAQQQEILPLPTLSLNYVLVGVGNFDGDGVNDDVAWRNVTDGSLTIWATQKGTLMPERHLTSPALAGLPWQLIGTGDFDGDRFSDLLWWNLDTGGVVVWLTTGVTLNRTVSLEPIQDPAAWRLVGMVDGDGEGKRNDLVWYNRNDGSVQTWVVQAETYQQTLTVRPAVADQSWRAVAVGDFDGQGSVNDLVWRKGNFAEVCDGVDNDGNGGVDDGFASQSCGAGACHVTVPSCLNGQANQACVPGPPSTEVCGNGVDEDCDGQDAVCPVLVLDGDGDGFRDDNGEDACPGEKGIFGGCSQPSFENCRLEYTNASCSGTSSSCRGTQVLSRQSLDTCMEWCKTNLRAIPGVKSMVDLKAGCQLYSKPTPFDDTISGENMVHIPGALQHSYCIRPCFWLQ